MPNNANVASPINIHGFGRSGTTVLQNILGQTGFIQVCNETAPLVFNCYRGGELLLPSHDKSVAGLPGDGSAPVRAVHAAFCATMASGKSAWCQKLGGIPNSVVWENLITDADRGFAHLPYEFPYGWYWRALRHCFPQSRDILILRDWRDIVASRVDYSGYKPADVARDLAVYWMAIAHPESRFDHVLRQPDLASAPEATVAQLFAALGLQYEERYLGALGWYASGKTRTLDEGRKSGFSWRAAFDAYGAAERRKLEGVMAPALELMTQRFAAKDGVLF
jgi:hypothetical protein